MVAARAVSRLALHMATDLRLAAMHTHEFRRMFLAHPAKASKDGIRPPFPVLDTTNQ